MKMKKGKYMAAIGIISGMLAVSGLSALAAPEMKEISTVELTDTEYNGTIYPYALQKQYETTDPDTKISFDEKLDGGLALEDVTYDTVETIYQTKILKETRDYKDLLEKDESKVAKSVDVGGETYHLERIIWSEEPNIEHVSYSIDYGYAASEPVHPDTYEYTYTSSVTREENTVTLPFVRMDKGDFRWVDGFTATVTFKNLDGEVFRLGSHEFSYNADKLSLTTSDYKELVKMLGYDASKYRLNSASWSGKAYKGKNGELYRDAKASGQQYAAPFKAVYEDDIENGKIYTAHAVYTCEVEIPAEESAPTYVMQVTAYYRKADISLLLSGGIIVLIFLVIGILYVMSKKQKEK